jgi:hypothetical protein
LDGQITKLEMEYVPEYGMGDVFYLRKKTAALIALSSAHKPTMKSFANFGNIEVAEVRNLNPVSVLSAKYLVIADPKSAFETLGNKKVASAKSSKKSAKSENK